MALTSYLYTQLVTKVRVTKGDSDLDANRARIIPVRASICGVSRSVGTQFAIVSLYRPP